MATANTQTDSTKFTADMVRTYLREISRVPLLTREQEIVYGKQVQQLMSYWKLKALAKKRREPTFRRVGFACSNEGRVERRLASWAALKQR